MLVISLVVSVVAVVAHGPEWRGQLILPAEWAASQRPAAATHGFAVTENGLHVTELLLERLCIGGSPRVGGRVEALVVAANATVASRQGTVTLCVLAVATLAGRGR